MNLTSQAKEVKAKNKMNGKPEPRDEALEEEMPCREQGAEKHQGAKRVSKEASWGVDASAPAVPESCTRDELSGQALPRVLMHKIRGKIKWLL